eukprot:288090_1
MTDCHHCKKPGATSFCSACKSTYYCNTECQRGDWKQHKKECKKLRKKLASNTKDKPEEKKSNTPLQNPLSEKIVHVKLPNNTDPSFINNLTEKDVKNIFVKICDSSSKPFDRLNIINSLFEPRIPSKYELYEKCGLVECFITILNESYQNLKDGKHDQIACDAQFLTLHFLSGIIMIKNYNNTGRDNIDEIYSYKLLSKTNIWNVYFSMIELKYCHIEWIRLFFRLLTLILNSNLCGKYIVDTVDVSKFESLQYLVNICNENVNMSNYIDYSEFAFNAAQGLAWQIFYQIDIHCKHFKVRNDIQSYLKKNDNQMYRMMMYPVAEKQIKENRALSYKEVADVVIDEQKK